MQSELSPRARRWLEAAVLPAFALLAVVVHLSAWASPTARYAGTGADTVMTIWALAWTPFALSHHMNPLFTDYMNYPLGVNMLWNSPILVAGIALWPVTALWGAVATFNVVMTASMALAAYFAYVAIRRFVPGLFPAVAGGLLYGFSPYMIAQELGHANLVLSALTPPVALILLDETLVRQRLRWWVLSGLIAILALVQYFIWQEILLTEVLAAAVVGVIVAIVRRRDLRKRLPYATRVLIPAAALTAALLAYPVYFQFFGPALSAGNLLPDRAGYVATFVTDLLNFVVPTRVQLITPPAAQAVAVHFTGNLSEWNGYIGIPLLLFLGFVLVRYRRAPVVLAASAAAVTFAVLSLGNHLHVNGVSSVPLPWRLFSHVPLLDSVLPNRLMLYFFLAAGVLLAFGLRGLWLDRRGFAVPVLAGCFALLPLLPAAPLPSTAISAPGFFSSDASGRLASGSVVLAAPWPSQATPDASNWQRVAGMRFRLLGGYYVGPDAPGDDRLRTAITRITDGRPPPALDQTTAHATLGQLTNQHVAAIVVGPSAHRNDLVTYFTALLGSPPASLEGVDVWLLAPG